MARVRRPGARIGLADSTPDSLIGRMFRVLRRQLPPLAGVQPPALWGTVAHLPALVGARTATRQAQPRHVNFRDRSAAHCTEVLRTWTGPVHKVFGALPRRRARR